MNNMTSAHRVLSVRAAWHLSIFHGAFHSHYPRAITTPLNMGEKRCKVEK